MTPYPWLVRARSWISITALVPVGVLAAFSPLRYPEGWGRFGFQSVGWLLFMAGAAMRWWATLYVGDRKSVELISAGPYSITRNPIYLGTLLLTLSVAVLSQSLSMVLMLLVVAVFYVGITVSREENRLTECHGERFKEYCRQVPRFFPRFRSFHTPDAISVRTHGLWTELVRTSRWMWIPILCDLVTHFRTAEGWPKWFNLP
jgi:protein-S-isoprenylcysteine O-methyltransferase Ste14